MANPQIILADLRAGRLSDDAEVRLIRFWEARNVRRGGELMSLDMLFVDEDVSNLSYDFFFPPLPQSTLTQVYSTLEDITYLNPLD